MSINLKVLVVFLSIWTAAAIREHIVKSHDPRPTITQDTTTQRDSTAPRTLR